VLFWPFKLAMKVVSLLLTAAIAYLVLSAIQVELAARGSTTPSAYTSAPAIVVLAPYGSTGSIDAAVTDRLQSAGAFYTAHLAPRVVVALCGNAQGSTSARSAISTALVGDGVPSATTTYLDSSSVVDGIRSVGSTLGSGSKAIVVTDAVNALWTKGAAVGAGLDPQVAPTPQSKVAVYSEIVPLLREATGVAAGRIIGDLRAFWAGN
jgi:hypothetical protein